MKFEFKKTAHIYEHPSFGENWFTFSKLYSDMVKEFPSGSKFVEVGAWKGKSAAYMAVEIINSDKNIDFHVVDTWEGSEEHMSNPELKDLYEIFISNMKPVENYYKPMRMTSIDAAKLFDDESLDFVFIDAAHDYENVTADIKAWYPKVKKGGVLAGHDFYPDQPTWGDVYRAVTDIFGKNHSQVEGSCFFIRK